MRFTDSHCHLDFEEFANDRKQLLIDCAAADIHRIIVPTITPKNWQSALNLSASNQQSTHCKIFACLGIHPWFLTDLTDVDLAALSQQVKLNLNNIVAIGETGIDNVIAEQQNNYTQQHEFFVYQLELARQYELPVIIHHRRSHPDIQAILKSKPLNGGIIHAFSGSYQQAKDYIDLGFKLGIGGTITYPRAKKTINAIKRLPLSSLVLETDAPSMPLYQFQGQHNSPLQVINVFTALCQIRAESAEVIAEQIELNIDNLLGLS
ncbi:TatD family hydrolase [Colwelliaceae bacterium 6471]